MAVLSLDCKEPNYCSLNRQTPDRADTSYKFRAHHGESLCHARRKAQGGAGRDAHFHPRLTPRWRKWQRRCSPCLLTMNGSTRRERGRFTSARLASGWSASPKRSTKMGSARIATMPRRRLDGDTDAPVVSRLRKPRCVQRQTARTGGSLF